jgi:hypothetical protein
VTEELQRNGWPGEKWPLGRGLRNHLATFNLSILGLGAKTLQWQCGGAGLLLRGSDLWLVGISPLLYVPVDLAKIRPRTDMSKDPLWTGE